MAYPQRMSPATAKGSVGHKKATIAWGSRGTGDSVIICHCPITSIDDLVTAVHLARDAIKKQLP